MTSSLPTIAPSLLARILEEAPGRVRKRLDKQPKAADDWDWNVSSLVIIDTGNERVQIEALDNHVSRMEQVRCSCLLTPKCFHVLACVSRLPTYSTDLNVDEEESSASFSSTPVETHGPLSASRRDAAVVSRQAVAALLQVGARAAGTLVLSGLLRAAHQCRAERLVNLANVLLRLETGVRFFREQSEQASVADLRRDLFLALTITHRLMHDEAIPNWCIGTLRRQYESVDLSKLVGVFAEPILTSSGYAGLAVTLATEDSQLFQILDHRPGGDELIRRAYHGGIELGKDVFKGATLARAQITTQRLVASREGRLGKGTATRWAIQSNKSLPGLSLVPRFTQSLWVQIQDLFRKASLPEDERPVGWDIVALEGLIVGGVGSGLAIQHEQTEQLLLLSVAHESPSLAYRENLQLLTRCPGLPIRVLGRLRVESAGVIEALAIGTPIQELVWNDEVESPRLAFPESWEGVCNLGLDKLERHHFKGVKRWSEEVALDVAATIRSLDGLDECRRRLNAIALGGQLALPRIESKTHHRDLATMRQRHQKTGADLLDWLAATSALEQEPRKMKSAQNEAAPVDFPAIYQACEQYLETAGLEFHRQAWMALFGDKDAE